jgi:hypothetical protein
MNPLPSDPAPRLHLPVWLPWLLAPGFTLLPIAGCGAAAAFQRSQGIAETAPCSGSPPPLVPVTAVVTMVSPGR